MKIKNIIMMVLLTVSLLTLTTSLVLADGKDMPEQVIQGYVLKVIIIPRYEEHSHEYTLIEFREGFMAFYGIYHGFIPRDKDVTIKYKPIHPNLKIYHIISVDAR